MASLCGRAQGCRKPYRVFKGTTLAARRLAVRSSALVVVGALFRGISTKVVTPPAAAARVALLKPAQAKA